MPSTPITPNKQRQQSEALRLQAGRLHRQMIWIAVAVLPLYPDYLFMPEGWQHFFLLRMALVGYFVALNLVHRRLHFAPMLLGYMAIVPLLLFLSYLTAHAPAEHSFVYNINYSAVFIVSSLFLLWHWRHTLVVVAISLGSYLVCFQLYSTISLEGMVQSGALLLFTIGAAGVALTHLRHRAFLKEFSLRWQLEQSNLQLQHKNGELEDSRAQILAQKTSIETKNAHITASITYAQRIQAAILGDAPAVEQLLGNAFILFKPKDIVSGDFYWYTETQGRKVLVAADCTGHGVPGAFMTVLGHALLNDIVLERGITDPAKMLHLLDERITATLQKEHAKTQANDGMDVSVLVVDGPQLHFAGAKNPLYYVNEGQMQVIKGSKFPIGSSQYKVPKVFETHTLAPGPGSMFYLFSDGFQDQFGGPQGRKFMSKHFRKLLLENSALPLPAQQEALDNALSHWQGALPQTDDILVIGLKWIGEDSA